MGATASRICRQTGLEACAPLTAMHVNHGSREAKLDGKLEKCRANPRQNLFVLLLLLPASQRAIRKHKHTNILTQEDYFRLWTTPCPSQVGAGILHRLTEREAQSFLKREAASLTLPRESTAVTQPFARSPNPTVEFHTVRGDCFMTFGGFQNHTLWTEI